MKTKRTHKEVGNDDIVESEQFGLTKQIGGEKEDFYKVSVTVETDSKKYTAEVMNLFVPLLRQIRRQMKSDPNQLSLLADGASFEVVDEETGEVETIHPPEKKPSRFKMPPRSESKKKNGKLPRATVS